jgi:coniferyl-aldehyde dehydrogenase
VASAAELESGAPKERIAAAHARLRKGFAGDFYPSAAVRKDRISRVMALLAEGKEQICSAVHADYGSRSRTQTAIADVFVTIEALRHARDHLGRWMKPERRPLPWYLAAAGAHAEVTHHPLGVVGVIGPWNFPINLLLSPLAGIFAAGNRACLKPSELTPRTAALLGELIPKYFAADELAVVTGGPDVGEAFCAAGFDHLLYTGSGRVAAQVLAAAAPTLTPVTLELGGKSPAFIGRSANIRDAARRIVGGKLLNMGQACIAPDYVLAPQDLSRRVSNEIMAAAREFTPDPRNNPDVSAIVNAAHFDRIDGLIQDAVRGGATLLHADDMPAAAGDRRMPITVLLDPPDSARIMREEIFGPVLMVRSYANLYDAIGFIQDRTPPLAVYYFGRDQAEERILRETTRSGAFVINDVVMQYTVEDLPFGGVGPSGMGAYHGRDGFRRFSTARALYRQSPFDLAAAVRPPFTPRKQKLFDALIRLRAR